MSEILKNSPEALSSGKNLSLRQKVNAITKRTVAIATTVGAMAIAACGIDGIDDVFCDEGEDCTTVTTGGTGGKGETVSTSTGTGANTSSSGGTGGNGETTSTGTGANTSSSGGMGGMGGNGGSSMETGGGGATGTGGAPCLGTEINLQDMAEYEYAQYRGGCTDADRIASSLGGGFTTGNTTLCLEPGDKLVTQVHDNADNNAWQYHLNSGNYLNNVKKVHLLQTTPMDAATANLYCTDALTYTNVNATGDDQDGTPDGYKYEADTDGVNIFRGTAN